MRTKNQVYEALDEALNHRAWWSTPSSTGNWRNWCIDECDSLGLPAIDLITPLLMRLSEFFGRSPEETPGPAAWGGRGLFSPRRGVEFTVKHDDGQEPRHLPKADIVLVGVSRTSKTPVVHLPGPPWLEGGQRSPGQGDRPARGTLSRSTRGGWPALVIDPQRLVELRAARLRNLGQDPRTAYADYEEIEEELRFCPSLFRRHPWVVMDVTGKAVEETANEVLVKLKLK